MANSVQHPVRLLRFFTTPTDQWRRKGYLGGGGLSVGKESCMRISEKLTFGYALLELDTGVIQKMKSLHLQLVAVQSIYVAHKMATTGTYPSIYKCSEGRGAVAPLAPPPYSYPCNQHLSKGFV